MSVNKGEAKRSEEYVPTTIPIRSAKINPLIAAPPKMKMIKRTTKVVMDVLNVLDKVELSAPFTSD